MPYKIGFQPAGVKTDRTGEFMDDRRRWAEERDKEEGRLGRRWAKVSGLPGNMFFIVRTAEPCAARRTALQPDHPHTQHLRAVATALVLVVLLPLIQGGQAIVAPLNGGAGFSETSRGLEGAQGCRTASGSRRGSEEAR
jgi:hypothetical protein